MEQPPHGYSAAEALRSGPPAAVRGALLAARQRTLAQAEAWAAALGESMPVPYRPTLNPPLWELGHVGWFQEYWIARNRQRGRGVQCDPDHARSDGAQSMFPQQFERLMAELRIIAPAIGRSICVEPVARRGWSR